MSWWKWKRNLSSFFSKAFGNDSEPWGSMASILPGMVAPLLLTRSQQSAPGEPQHYYGQNSDRSNWANPTPACFLYLGNGRGSTLEQGSGWNLKGELKWAMALLWTLALWPSAIFAPLSISYQNPDCCVNLDSWTRTLEHIRCFFENVQIAFWVCCKHTVYQRFLSKSGRLWSLLSEFDLFTAG